MRGLVATVRIKCLDNRLTRRHETNLITDGERGFQAVILNTDFAPLGRNAVAGSLDLPQPLPAVGLFGARQK